MHTTSACWWYYDHYGNPQASSKRYAKNRLRLVRQASLAQQLIAPNRLLPAIPASWEVLALVHDKTYLQKLKQNRLNPAEQRRIGLTINEGMVNRARASVEAACQAAQHAIRHGMAGVVGGGAHHAFSTHGAGYCILNDIAIAIQHLLAQRRVKRVSIVDLDVHQGDGNAAIFAHEQRVFTLSVHGEKNWPHHKQHSNLDVPLADDTQDDAYLAALTNPLQQAICRFSPDLVFYLAGVDPLASDCLGRLALTPQGLQLRDERVLRACHRAGVPVVVTLAGGYSLPIEYSVQAHLTTFSVMQVFSSLG